LPIAAIELGPDNRSRFVGPERRAAAIAVFQPIWDRVQKLRQGRYELDATR
jgi:hypothetical protein